VNQVATCVLIHELQANRSDQAVRIISLCSSSVHPPPESVGPWHCPVLLLRPCVGRVRLGHQKRSRSCCSDRQTVDDHRLRERRQNEAFRSHDVNARVPSCCAKDLAEATKTGSAFGTEAQAATLTSPNVAAIVRIMLPFRLTDRA